jgi:hypothetical protein
VLKYLPFCRGELTQLLFVHLVFSKERKNFEEVAARAGINIKILGDHLSDGARESERRRLHVWSDTEVEIKTETPP